MFAWMFLVGAICFEIAGTLLLKLSDGFSKWQWCLSSIACYWASFAMITPALKDLPVGVVYAIWAGMGIVGVTAFGIILFGERLAMAQYGCVGLILVGAVGLRLTTAA